MVTPVQQAAVNDITSKLDDNGWFNTVTHDEMNQVADVLRGLSATDADAVVDELQRTGQLDRLASEAVDGSWFGNGGYSDGERQALFSDLAGKLDGQSLAALSNAFARTDDGAAGHSRVGEIADAVTRHSSASAMVDYIGAMAGKTTDRANWHENNWGTVTMHQSDAEAAAVAKVLGTLTGGQAEAAFRQLNPEQLRAVMQAGIDQTSTTTGGSQVVDWNAETTRTILHSAATMGDADLKARVFDAGVDTLRTIREVPAVGLGVNAPQRGEELATLTEGLTRIIDSDTTGVVRELAYNRETMDGSDLAGYSRQMMESGQEAKLGEIMAKLQFGNDLQGDPARRLDEVTQVPVPGGQAQDRRENAGALGYFVGSTYAAANAITKDVARQQEFTTAVLDSALAIIDKAGVGGRVVGGVASVAKEWTQYAVRAAIEDPGTSAATQLERAALPVNPTTGELGVGDNIRNAFNTTLDHVHRTARP